MSLSQILQEMEDNKANAQMDVTMGSPNTFGARQGLKRAAIETIKRLRMQYRDELMSSTVFIVVTGPSQDTFAEIAGTDTFGCFPADPDAFYKELASRVTPSLFGRDGVRQLFNIINNILEDKMLELDIVSYNALQFNDKYNRSVTTPDELALVLRQAINDQIGSEIVGVNAIHAVVGKAIDKGHKASVTPIVLNTADEKFALDLVKNLRLLKAKTFLVVAGKPTKTLQAIKDVTVVKNVTEESVGEALSTIRNYI